MADPRAGQNTGEIDAGAQLVRLLKAAKRSTWQLVMYSVVGLILGALVAAILPELYESKTIILLRERQLIEDSSILRAIEDKPLQIKEQTLEEEFKSYAFIGEVLNRAGWQDYKEIQRRLNNPDEFLDDTSDLDPRKIDAIRRRAQDDQQDLIEKIRLDKHYKVSVRNTSSGELLVVLSMKWFDSKRARDFVFEARRWWVDKRDEDYKRYYRKQLDDADRTLATRKKAFETVAQTLEEFERQNNMSSLNDENTDPKLKTDLSLQLNSLQGQIADLEVRVRGLDERKASTPATNKLTTSQPNPEYDALKAALDAERAVLLDLSMKKTDTNPDVVKQRGKVQDAEAAFKVVAEKKMLPSEEREEPNAEYVEITKALATFTPELAGLRERAIKVEKMIQEIDERLTRQPLLQGTLKRLENEYQLARESLNEAVNAIRPLQEKVARWEGGGAGVFADPEKDLKDSGGYEVLEDPYEASEPSGIPRIAIALIGLLVGLAAGFASMFLGEMVRSTFDDAHEVQSALQVPVLASIGRIATAGELRQARVRTAMGAVGSMLLVGVLGVLVLVTVTSPEKLPLTVQQYLRTLKTSLQ